MNLHAKVVSSIKKSLLISLLLTLTACEDEFNLHYANNENIGKLKLQVTANFPSPAYAIVNGMEFAGEWDRAKIYEADIAKRHRLVGTKSYAEYMRGSSADQLNQGHATLVAKNNTKLECNFVYRSQFQSGSCSLNDDDQKIIMQKPLNIEK